MSSWIEEHTEDQGWETVETGNKKKNKGKSGIDELVVITLELALDSEAFRAPVTSIQPENKRLVGQYLVHYKKGIIKGPDGKVRRAPPPQFFKDLPGPTKITPAKSTDNPLTQFGEFSMRLAQDGLENPEDVLPTIHLMIGRGVLKKIMKCFDPLTIFILDPHSIGNRLSSELKGKINS